MLDVQIMASDGCMSSDTIKTAGAAAIDGVKLSSPDIIGVQGGRLLRERLLPAYEEQFDPSRPPSSTPTRSMRRTCCSTRSSRWRSRTTTGRCRSRALRCVMPCSPPPGTRADRHHHVHRAGRLRDRRDDRHLRWAELARRRGRRRRQAHLHRHQVAGRSPLTGTGVTRGVPGAAERPPGTIREGCGRTCPERLAVDRRVNGIATIPWRRIILIILGGAIAFVVVVGSYKTLTLPEGGYSGDFWIDQIVNGLGQGAILALIALGYTLVYGILRMINFAHGEVFMAGAFISFFADAYQRSGFLNSQPFAALDPAGRRDRGVDARRRAARTHRVSSAAQRASVGAVDHRDRGVAVHRERVPRLLRTAAVRLPRPTILEGSIEILGCRSRRCSCWSSSPRSWRCSGSSSSCTGARPAGRCARSRRTARSPA